MMSSNLNSMMMMMMMRLVILIIIIKAIRSINGQESSYFGDDCNSTSTQSVSSSYRANLNEALSWLSTYATTPTASNHTTIANNSAGTAANDTAYGLYDCRGDDPAYFCRFCVSTAITEIQQRCLNRVTAVIWYDFCLIRYSNQNFFGIVTTTPSWHSVQPENVSDATEPAKAESFMRSLIKEATDERKKYYAMGGFDLGGGKMRYGLVQCSRDLSSKGCKQCLEAMVNEVPKCCENKQGWQVLCPSCLIKYDDYMFYQPNSSTNSTPASNGGSKSKSQKAFIISISVVMVALALLLSCIVYHFWRRKKALREEEMALETSPTVSYNDVQYVSERENSLNTDLPTIPLIILQHSTNHFSHASKLGEGGFGPVYKGTLPDGREVAVKRLSITSGQGLEEFKNEVIFIAKLQHRNLVRLLGCCIEHNDKLLVYEYMPNSSLDFHLFNEERRKKLDWKQRLNIINGIAKGLLYLHEDSRLRVIHRDLKASNVLLDHEMNPKISDFGLAKTFEGGQNQGNTTRVMGTYGYMPPEYAMEGLFSVKSDVFSFGVLLLEIITGKRNSGFYLSNPAGQSLLIYAWKLWCEGKCLELMDPILKESYISSEVLKCIHIGLLCVEEDAADRPTMSSVLVMLSSDHTMTLPNPNHPAFSVGRMPTEESSSKNSNDASINNVTVTCILPR